MRFNESNVKRRLNESGSFYGKRIEEKQKEYDNAVEKINGLRRKYLDCATGLTMGRLENKLKAKHYLKEIKKHKRDMRMKGFI